MGKHMSYEDIKIPWYSKFCSDSPVPIQRNEQKIYLEERKRLDALEARKKSEKLERVLRPENTLHAPGCVASSSEYLSPHLSPLRRVRRSESFDPLQRHSQVILDEMHFRFKNTPRVTDRRNAMENPSHRKNLMQGMLSITTGGIKPPDPHLKEGKKLPIYLKSEKYDYSQPEHCNVPLDDPDDFYNGETYIVMNKHGTVFRFSKDKSLFLFGLENKVRSTVVNLFITPMFAHFITFVILCNCACMVLVEPPKWIEDYLEYVFTIIYMLEASIKIIARGFVLHQFSYLRDPWNWLDFIVIVTAIITEVLKAVTSKGTISKVAVLRAFRVLRALKTMSVVPGLRAIVKALLRSIKALKDAVVLTIFCVSVFGLVGYQLFHGTLRQKCVRISGSLQLPPDSMFLHMSNGSNLRVTDFQTNSAYLEQVTLNQSTWVDETGSHELVPLYSSATRGHNYTCADMHYIPKNDDRRWSKSDVAIMEILLNKTMLRLNSTMNYSTQTTQLNTSKDFCSFTEKFSIRISSSSSLMRIADRMARINSKSRYKATEFDPGGWNCSFLSSNSSSKNETFSSQCDASVLLYAANISCLKVSNSTDNGMTSQQHLLTFGDLNLPRWFTRQFVMLFRFTSSEINDNLPFDVSLAYFVYYSEMDTDYLKKMDLLKTWLKNEEHHCKSEPKTGLFFHVGSSNRPLPEPLYCAIGSKDNCPLGYHCAEAGSNPDFGYTSFDNFFVAFLTSFRLVALDAWSRLYYLTLHTAGPTYSIFYILVVFLGSYYLVNLILAVVYMAYEEQQAVVDEEEDEAKAREEEERELEREINSNISSCLGSSDVYSEDAESPAPQEELRMGLITTSLGPSSGVSRGSLSYKRRKIRNRSHTVGVRYPTAEIDHPFSDNEEEAVDRRRYSKHRPHSFRRKVRRVNSDVVKDTHDHKFSFYHKRASSMRSKVPENERCRRKLEGKLSTPVIQFVVTEPYQSSPPNLSKNGLMNASASDNHLTVNSTGISTSLTADVESAHPTPKIPVLLPDRRWSETSTNSDAESSKETKVIQVDIETNRDKNKQLLIPLIPPDHNMDDNVSSKSLLSFNSAQSSPPLLSNSTQSNPEDINHPISQQSTNGNGEPFHNAESLSHFEVCRRNFKTLPGCNSPTEDIPAQTDDSSLKSNGFIVGSQLESSVQIQIPTISPLSHTADETEAPLIHKEHHHHRRRKVRRKSLYQRISFIFVNTFAKWNCLPKWFTLKIQNVVLNPFTDLIITLCIALNALFMTIEHHPMQPWFTTMLEQANLFFTIVFTVEMIMKIIGLSPYTYFRQRWNVFDAVVVLFSLLEIAIKSTGGFTILRAFRLMRIVKLAKQWPTLNKLLRIIGRTLGKLWHLTIVFLLVLYIFAVVGMQLLHKYYNNKFKDNLPRWNFSDFPHAFMVVFRIQCGEWVENMFVCLNVASPGICIPLFMLVYVIGNLVILNLFLALLLNSFSGDVLQQTASESNSISEAIRRVKIWMKTQRQTTKTFSSNAIRFPRKSKPIKVPTEEVQTPDTELTIISSDKKSEEGLSPNGSHIPAILEDEEEAEKSPQAFPEGASKRHSDNFLTIENGHFNSVSVETCISSSSHLNGSSRYSINSTSEWSLQSGNQKRGRRRRRNSRNVKMRARERYRGISAGSDQSCKDGLHSDNSTSRDRRDLTERQTNTTSEKEKQKDPTEDEKVGGSSGNCTTAENSENATKKSIEPCLSCWPKSIFDRGFFYKVRRQMFTVIEHRYFDNLVIFAILLSSVTLAMEDIHLHKKPVMEMVVNYIDMICCIFFTMEMIMKWIGYGWKHYFTNPWCLLDCIIVTISIINLSMTSAEDANLSAFRALRTFRALRPLRALSRFKGMKVVVDALIRAIPPILHVFMVCLVFWLIFSILGVNIFGGRFGRCVALPTGDILPLRVLHNETEEWRRNLPPTNVSLEDQCSQNNTLLIKYLRKEIILHGESLKNVLPAVRNKQQCELCAEMLGSTDINWHIPSVNFDSVPLAYLALMQVATFNGWLEVMESAIDITGVEMQPHYEISFYNYLYFCVFIIFGAFFSLNLFIGVIIDNFNQQKLKQKGGEDGVFLTDEQRQYYNAMRKMAAKTPKKPIPRPENAFMSKIYNLVTDRKFEMVIMALIIVNLVVMAIEHYNMSPELNDVLQNLNLAFICIFLVEAVLKLIGLRQHYFTIPWNVFDILVVVVSLIATGLNDVMSQYFVQPTLFRIIRLFRVTRILRLIREAKGIRTLLFALMMSLPALFNIGSLLFLIMSIYAIIGMSQFPYVQKIAGVDNILNFETFPNAFLVLFQVSTSEGWDKFIEPILRDRSPYCDPNPVDGSEGNCGNSTIGVFYFVTYVMTTFLIVVNMYIAVILENFEVATRENSEPLTADDFEQFFEIWQRYDDCLTQFITFEQLKRLLNELDYPLRVPMPNTPFISNSHMRITLDGKVHCLEVIIALIKRVLGDSPQLENLKDAMNESFMLKCKSKDQTIDNKNTIDSEQYTWKVRAAIKIQRWYRKYKFDNI